LREEDNFTLVVQDSYFQWNNVTEMGGGAFVFIENVKKNAGGTVVFINTIFLENSAPHGGGFTYAGEI